MSKSLGNIIDPNKWVEKYGADVVRYFLLREVPFGQDGDMSEEKLRERYRSDLANNLGNLFSRLTNMIEKFAGGQVPDITQSSQKEKLQQATDLTVQLKFSQALETVLEVLAWANQTIDKEKLWELPGKDDEKLTDLFNDLTATLYEAAKALSPYIPESAEKIRTALSADKITKAGPLFPSLE